MYPQRLRNCESTKGLSRQFRTPGSEFSPSVCYKLSNKTVPSGTLAINPQYKNAGSPVRKVWKKGELLTATQLNKLKQRVEQMITKPFK